MVHNWSSPTILGYIFLHRIPKMLFNKVYQALDGHLLRGDNNIIIRKTLIGISPPKDAHSSLVEVPA